MKALHLAEIIVTNETTPVINGALLIEDSKIVSAGRIEDFGDITKYKVVDHKGSLICPGFINLHTHLLYSKAPKINGLEGLFPWLKSLISGTESWQEKDYIDSINYGIEQALSTGTTFIVENTPSYLSAKELSKSPLRALIGFELFGSDEEKADALFKIAIEQISKCHSQLDWESSSNINTNINQNLDSRFRRNDRIELTFSPHAPYDVSSSLWKNLIDWSVQKNKPILTHLEESSEEKLWWQNKSGKAVEFWKFINKLEPKLKYWKKYNSGIDFLNKNNLLNKNILGTHLCQASKEDLQILKERNIHLVHCPRSNYFLNNGVANLRLWNELGLLWGIGTDSIASNENLDLLEEVRFAVNQQSINYGYTISGQEAFRAITSNAAKILSKEKELGYLKKGCNADFLAYNLRDKSACTHKDPYNALIFNIDNKKDLKEVWIEGQHAWKNEGVLNRI